jgi:hypothetical protein
MRFGLHCGMSTNRSAFFALVLTSILLLGCNPVPRRVHLILKDGIEISRASILSQKGFFDPKDSNNSCNYLPSFMLFKDGYLLKGNPKLWEKVGSDEIRNSKIRWGKYKVNGDSIQIEYYRKRNIGYMEAGGYKGYFVNDTTICLYSHYAYLSLSGKPFKRGIIDDTCNVPIVYHFVPYTDLPSSDNWIKRKGY